MLTDLRGDGVFLACTLLFICSLSRGVGLGVKGIPGARCLHWGRARCDYSTCRCRSSSSIEATADTSARAAVTPLPAAQTDPGGARLRAEWMRGREEGVLQTKILAGPIW